MVAFLNMGPNLSQLYSVELSHRLRLDSNFCGVDLHEKESNNSEHSYYFHLVVKTKT